MNSDTENSMRRISSGRVNGAKFSLNASLLDDDVYMEYFSHLLSAESEPSFKVIYLSDEGVALRIDTFLKSGVDLALDSPEAIDRDAAFCSASYVLAALLGTHPYSLRRAAEAANRLYSVLKRASLVDFVIFNKETECSLKRAVRDVFLTN